MISSVCHSVRLSVSRITDFIETWRYDWTYQSEDLINFRWRSSPAYGFRITYLLP